jgi:hypothetical protein
MRKRKVTLKITTTTRQTIRIGDQGLRSHCSRCEREVLTLTRMQAAGALEVSEQTLARLVDNGQIHAIETVIGNERICKESLSSESGSAETNTLTRL